MHSIVCDGWKRRAAMSVSATNMMLTNAGRELVAAAAVAEP